MYIAPEQVLEEKLSIPHPHKLNFYFLMVPDETKSHMIVLSDCQIAQLVMEENVVLTSYERLEILILLMLKNIFE